MFPKAACFLSYEAVGGSPIEERTDFVLCQMVFFSELDEIVFGDVFVWFLRRGFVVEVVELEVVV